MHLSESIPSQAQRKTSKKSNSLGAQETTAESAVSFAAEGRKKIPNNQANRKPSGK